MVAGIVSLSPEVTEREKRSNSVEQENKVSVGVKSNGGMQNMETSSDAITEFRQSSRENSNNINTKYSIDTSSRYLSSSMRVVLEGYLEKAISVDSTSSRLICPLTPRKKMTWERRYFMLLSDGNSNNQICK